MAQWTEDKMRAAELTHGPDSVNTDTYRLSIPGEGDKPGMRLDVPGWMVGDPEGVRLRMQAAKIIRQRLQQ